MQETKVPVVTISIGDVLPARTFIDMIHNTRRSMENAFVDIGTRYNFHTLNMTLSEGDEDYEMEDLFHRIYDLVSYCHVLGFSLEGRLEKTPELTHTITCIDVDFVNLSALCLNKAKLLWCQKYPDPVLAPN